MTGRKTPTYLLTICWNLGLKVSKTQPEWCHFGHSRLYQWHHKLIHVSVKSVMSQTLCQQTDMAAPRGTQIQIKRILILNKYWYTHQMKHANGNICTFSTFSGPFCILFHSLLRNFGKHAFNMTALSPITPFHSPNGHVDSFYVAVVYLLLVKWMLLNGFCCK